MGNRKRKADYKSNEIGDDGVVATPISKKKPKYEREHKERKAWPADQTWSKSKKKRMRAIKAKQRKQDGIVDDQEKTSSKDSKKRKKGKSKKSKDGAAASAVVVAGDNKTKAENSKKVSLQDKFKAQLSGSRFRILNEELYTTTSSEAFDRFKENPELFQQYHDGFRHQVEDWPVNPVDVMVKTLKNIAKKAKGSEEKIVVADFGCGEAQLAKQLLQYKLHNKENDKMYCPFTVHSFDLVAPNDLVTACDMANVPLESSTVDVGIFCLSLMGTNLADFIREAHRILKKKTGQLFIAEVRSRFETTSGKDDIKDFIGVLEHLGFKCKNIDRSNKMFVVLELQTSGKAPKKDLEFTAKPCIYKRR